jgi:hypothetical protein
MQKGDNFLHANFRATKEELSVGESTNHVVIEGNHCWVVCYSINEACVPIKHNVSMQCISC